MFIPSISAYLSQIILYQTYEDEVSKYGNISLSSDGLCSFEKMERVI